MSANVIGLLKAELLERGLLTFTVDNRPDIVPPAVVTPSEVTTGLRTHPAATGHPPPADS